MDKHKSYILVGFLNPTNKQKYTFHYNIKFNSDYFKEKKINNSKEIYDNYKKVLKSSKVDKFFKYIEKDEETINNIFNNIIENISNYVYNKKSIFKDDSKIDNIKEKKDNKKDTKDTKSNTKYKKKYNPKWDKENLYVDIDKYNDEMLNIEVHEDNKLDEDELFKEFEDDSYSPVRKLFFINDSYYKNFKGGGKTKVLKGRRYIND